jgi:hypothetical protein
MSGKRYADAYYIAGLLKEGYKPRLVGDEPLLGVTAPLLWVDGELVEGERRHAQPGLLLTREGTIFFATLTRQRAEDLLIEAQEIDASV